MEPVEARHEFDGPSRPDFLAALGDYGRAALPKHPPARCVGHMECIMAKRLKPGEDPDALAGSLTDKKKIIAEAARDIIALELERKGVGERISEVRGRIKSAGILQADFNAALRLFKLEGDERSQSMDGLRVCFEALALGGQGELFPGATPPAGEAKPTVAVEVKGPKGRRAGKGANGKNGDAQQPANLGDFKAQKEAAKEAGRKAYGEGKTPDDCPYEEEPLRIAWITGLDLEAEETESGARGGKKTLEQREVAGTAD